MPLQPKPGITTYDKVEPRLQGATLMPVLIGDFGADASRDETRLFASIGDVIRTFLPTIEIDGQTIELSADRLPLPEVLTEYLLSQPGSGLAVLEELEVAVDLADPQQLSGIFRAITE